MTLEEINKQLVVVDGVKYTPISKCVKLENGEISYEIIKTAQEVYEEIRSKKIDICPVKTTEERLEEIDAAIDELKSMYYEILMEV